MFIQTDIEKAYREGRRLYRSFSKSCNVVTVAGVAFDMSMLSGNPVANYYIGSEATATALARSTNGGLDHGPNVPDGYKKFLNKMLVQTITAGAIPCTLELLDYLMFYPFIGMDVGYTALTTNITLPRYEASEGVQIMVVEQNPYVGSATAQITYTNQDGVEGRVTPVFTMGTVTNIGTIATSTPTLSGAKGVFVTLQDGDYGVQKIEGIELLTGDIGILCLVLVMPIATTFLYDITAPSEYDFWYHQGYLPEIKNDAYLNFVNKPAGSASGATFYGYLNTIWG